MGNHTKKGSVVIGIVVGVIIGAIGGYYFEKSGVGTAYFGKKTVPSALTQKAFALHQAMRKLWEDHIVWTRLYVVEAIAGLPGSQETAARLMKNQDDIGNAIKPYYGDGAGKALATLLKEHISGAVDVLNASKAGDQSKIDSANKAWYDNANRIAAFLSSANPKNWPLDAMKAEMKMHLDVTLAQVGAHLKGDYARSVAEYETVHDHILRLADTLSDGIVKQFSDKF